MAGLGFGVGANAPRPQNTGSNATTVYASNGTALGTGNHEHQPSGGKWDGMQKVGANAGTVFANDGKTTLAMRCVSAHKRRP